MRKNPYEVEFKRQKLAKSKDYSSLKKLYASNLPEIIDLNKPVFWDKKFSSRTTLSQQDGMTKDRVRTAAGFIPKGKLKVLDIGAGLGFVEELISRDRNKEIYANDFSSTSIKILKQKFSGNFKIQSIYNLKYTKEKFDVILILEVLEHIPPSKIFSVLKSINYSLKNNGTLIVSVPMNEGLELMKENPNGHVRLYSEHLIKAELKIAGFSVLESKSLFAFRNLYNMKKILSKILANKWRPNNVVIKLIKK